jgi:hypothetical protein
MDNNSYKDKLLEDNKTRTKTKVSDINEKDFNLNHNNDGIKLKNTDIEIIIQENIIPIVFFINKKSGSNEGQFILDMVPPEV